MTDIHEFDEIRPYFDEEVPEVINRIVKERGFLSFLKTFFPEHSTKKIIQNLLKAKKISDFQRQWVYSLIERIIHHSVSKLTFSGIENIEKNKPYLFISNHRDIVLDSALLQFILVRNDFKTTEIAIGSNLLILDWIIDLVKLNRTFIVKRDVPRIELYKYSVNLSKYIRFVLTEQKDSIWLAQREGRTKDGDDQTQVAVLKMLNLSGENDFFDNFKDLNIIPVSISYEHEPMDTKKVQELYDRKMNPEYKKTKLEDLNSMDGGIEKPKGHVHYHFGTPLNKLIPQIESINGRKERYDALANLLNEEIYRNYKLTFNNYVAADKYFNTTEYSKYYSDQEKVIFEEYMSSSLKEIKGEEKEITEMFLKIYAMPVKNYFNTIQK